MQNIKETLEFLNPWWKNGKVSEELAKEYKRSFFDKSVSMRSYRQIIILSGLRRVGKTTVLYQNIQELLKDQDPKRIVYFNFDKEITDILDLLNNYSDLTKIDYKNEKIFIFLDEVTKLKDWARQLKLIYDSLPNIKFFISSSSSINLEQDAIRELAGRYFLINVFPLNFREFLELKKLNKYIENRELYKKELDREFGLYFLRSFPETVFWEDELLIKDYLKTTIIDKIVKTDLSLKFKNLNLTLLKNLIDLFYSEPGFYLDYEKLSKDLQVAKKTLYKHIFYLEFCYLIRIVKNFRPSTLSTKRKMQRVYPYWWNLSISFCSNQDKLLENYIASIKNLKFYWRDANKEIDFIEIIDREMYAYEIKNKTKIEESDIKNLNFFNNKYGAKRLSLVSNSSDKDKGLTKLISFIDLSLDFT